MEKIQNKQTVLRQLQLTEKEILVDVAVICEKNHLRYYLSSGTLLGAVRHKGFIPWDDDIDLEMPLDDYLKFIKIAQSELGDKYFVQNSMTDPNFNFAYTKIRKNNTTLLNPYDKSYRIHHGIWIDIFPLVGVKPGISRKIQESILKISNFVQIQDKIDSHQKEFQRMLGPTGMTVMSIFSILPMKIRQGIHNIMLKVAFNMNSDKCEYCSFVWGNLTRMMPREVYGEEPAKLEFENDLFCVPQDYIKYLEVIYGDFMTLPPVSERYGHGNEQIVDFDHSYDKYMDYGKRKGIG